MDDDIGMHGRITLTGDLHLRLPTGGEVNVSKAEITCQGTFDAPTSAFRLELESTVAEISKMGVFHPELPSMLVHIAEKPPDTIASVTFEAEDDHMRALGAAAAKSGLDPQSLLENVEWMTLVFQFERYKVVSVATTVRWSEPIG